ncbi:MAG: type 1 glutamine amidotransferase [Anaerolineae bacterium]|nr:type 1 glutamine amidotransferase [Anaerolineae bacterium]
MRPFAVTMDVRDARRPMDYLRQTYVPFLQGLGIAPVLVPNVLSDPAAYVTALGVAGVVLTGGGDVAPARYGQPAGGSRGISAQRDAAEWALLDLALARGLPVLGICRGFQVINLYFGGGLIQDLPAHGARFLAHESDEPHEMALVHPPLRRLLEAETLRTNTHHHQGVTAAELAPDLIPFAVCADGVIEGLLHPTLPVLAVQWHPERPTPSAEHDRRLFAHFLGGQSVF